MTNPYFIITANCIFICWIRQPYPDTDSETKIPSQCLVMEVLLGGPLGAWEEPSQAVTWGKVLEM